MSSTRMLYSLEHLKQKHEWVETSRRSHCIICTKRFFLLMGKHHCRRCGDIMCKDCSVFAFAELQSAGKVRVRTCKICHEKDKNTGEYAAPLSSSEDEAAEEELLKQSEMMLFSPQRQHNIKMTKSERMLIDEDERATVQSYASAE